MRGQVIIFNSFHYKRGGSLIDLGIIRDFLGGNVRFTSLNGKRCRITFTGPLPVLLFDSGLVFRDYLSVPLAYECFTLILIVLVIFYF